MNLFEWLREWWQRQRYRRWRRRWTYLGIDEGEDGGTAVVAYGYPKGTVIIDEITRWSLDDMDVVVSRAKLRDLKRTTMERIQARMTEPSERHVFADFLESRKGPGDDES